MTTELLRYYTHLQLVLFVNIDTYVNNVEYWFTFLFCISDARKVHIIIDYGLRTDNDYYCTPKIKMLS